MDRELRMAVASYPLHRLLRVAQRSGLVVPSRPKMREGPLSEKRLGTKTVYEGWGGHRGYSRRISIVWPSAFGSLRNYPLCLHSHRTNKNLINCHDRAWKLAALANFFEEVSHVHRFLTGHYDVGRFTLLRCFLHEQ